MKRFFIFGLLGPPLGFVTAVWVLLPALNLALGAPSTFDYHQIVLLPVAYMVGLPSALLAALVDHPLAQLKVGRRILWTTLFSYAAGFLPILTSVFAGYMHGAYLVFFGLIGAVPGAICSALAERTVRTS